MMDNISYIVNFSFKYLKLLNLDFPQTICRDLENPFIKFF